MKYNKNNHNSDRHVDIDSICQITACLTDVILKPLYAFAGRRNLYDYAGVLKIVCAWANEFYNQYHEALKDWDSFEESKQNIYNAMSWDGFTSYWVNDRFKKYKSKFEKKSATKKWFANASTPKIIIVNKNNIVSSVLSTIPIVYAVIDLDRKGEFFIKTCESDSVAEDLCSLFDADEPIDMSIIKQLKHLGY
jgi:hypothetical protein